MACLQGIFARARATRKERRRSESDARGTAIGQLFGEVVPTTGPAEACAGRLRQIAYVITLDCTPGADLVADVDHYSAVAAAFEESWPVVNIAADA